MPLEISNTNHSAPVIPPLVYFHNGNYFRDDKCITQQEFLDELALNPTNFEKGVGHILRSMFDSAVGALQKAYSVLPQMPSILPQAAAAEIKEEAPRVPKSNAEIKKEIREIVDENIEKVSSANKCSPQVRHQKFAAFKKACMALGLEGRDEIVKIAIDGLDKIILTSPDKPGNLYNKNTNILCIPCYESGANDGSYKVDVPLLDHAFTHYMQDNLNIFASETYVKSCIGKLQNFQQQAVGCITQFSSACSQVLSLAQQYKYRAYPSGGPENDGYFSIGDFKDAALAFKFSPNRDKDASIVSLAQVGESAPTQEQKALVEAIINIYASLDENLHREVENAKADGESGAKLAEYIKKENEAHLAGAAPHSVIEGVCGSDPLKKLNNNQHTDL